jgi:hypothetical protein
LRAAVHRALKPAFDEFVKMLEKLLLHRSRTQIATSYAPGALFTYEGGLGCCVSVPISTPYTPSSPAGSYIAEVEGLETERLGHGRSSKWPRKWAPTASSC